MLFLFNMLSGKRDSDPRPQPWQGCALPTELFPQILRICWHFWRRLGIKQVFCSRLAQKFRLLWVNHPLRRLSLSIADAKVMLFSELANFFGVFFQKNSLIHPISVILIRKSTQNFQLSILMQHTNRRMRDTIERVRLHRRVVYHILQP